MVWVASTTPEESMRQNLETWNFEVDTVFQNHTIEGAKLFLKYMKGDTVVDMGAGDGAANRAFKKLHVTAVDINEVKLEKNTAQTKVCKDFVTYLDEVDGIDNVFMHHALEHYVDYGQVLELLAEKVKGYVYIAVPAREGIHSVHHVAFEGVGELELPGFKTLLAKERKYGNLYEYVYIGVKK